MIRRVWEEQLQPKIAVSLKVRLIVKVPPELEELRLILKRLPLGMALLEPHYGRGKGD